MRAIALFPLLLLLAGCVVAAGHPGYGHGYGRPYAYGPPRHDAPAYRPWHPPRHHWRRHHGDHDD
jgi:hypothetical protein